MPETASRLRGRLETILDYAAAKRLRPSENPARWRDLRHELARLRKVKQVEHHPALPWRRAPDFMAELRAHRATSARALELTILTAARTTEMLQSRRREFDLDSGTWTIPAHDFSPNSVGAFFRVRAKDDGHSTVTHSGDRASICWKRTRSFKRNWI